MHKNLIAKIILFPAAVLLTLFSNLPVGAASGDLDLGFNGDGKAMFGFGTNTFDYAADFVIQPDGKIVVGGFTIPLATTDLFLIRLTPSGYLDSTFGSFGKAKVSAQFGKNILLGMKLQPNGKIVVVGSTTPFAGSVNDQDSFVARFNPNGTIDSTFGANGIIKLDVGIGFSAAYDCLIRPNGKIVVVGVGTYQPHLYDFMLVQLTSSGALDPGFGTNGVVLGTTFDNASGQAAVLDGDKIVVAGFTNYSLVQAPGTFEIDLARYQPNGALDPSFGSNGKVVTNILSVNGVYENRPLDIAITQSGYVIPGYRADRIFPVLKYDLSGNLTSTFGNSPSPIQPGIATFPTADNGITSNEGIAVDANSRIVTVGVIRQSPQDLFGIVRYNSNGTVDTSFGIGGIVKTDPGTDSGARRVAIQADGKIVVVGTSQNGTHTDFAITRYLP